MILLDQLSLQAESTRAVDALADQLLRPRAHRGLVVDGHLEGLLSITDLARALQARRPPRPSLSNGQLRCSSVQTPRQRRSRPGSPATALPLNARTVGPRRRWRIPSCG